MSPRLEHKTALVTGATSNIGRAIATAFAAEGAHVIVSGRNPQRGAEVVGHERDVSRSRGRLSMPQSAVASQRRWRREGTRRSPLPLERYVEALGGKPEIHAVSTTPTSSSPPESSPPRSLAGCLPRLAEHLQPAGSLPRQPPRNRCAVRRRTAPRDGVPPVP